MATKPNRLVYTLLFAAVGLIAACQSRPAVVTAPLPTRSATAVPSPTSRDAAAAARTDTQPAAPTALPTTMATDSPTATATATAMVPTILPTTVPTTVPTTIIAATIPAASAATVPSASPTAATTAAADVTAESVQQIGTSAGGRPLLAYHFGTGSRRLIFVGGIHGGYEWNTIVLAHEMMDYLRENPAAIPSDLTVTIIPSANPDGEFLITGEDGFFDAADVGGDTAPGRFNANNVDLNRNWDCNWQPTALWRDNPISGGSAPFSEPETAALRAFLIGQAPQAVVFWHSAANGVFAAGCPDTHDPSLQLAQVYADAGGYPVYTHFYHYPVTGDAGDWLTTQGIPSISIELRTHESIDWEQNLNGTLAVLDYYR